MDVSKGAGADVKHFVNAATKSAMATVGLSTEPVAPTPGPASATPTKKTSTVSTRRGKSQAKGKTTAKTQKKRASAKHSVSKGDKPRTGTKDLNKYGVSSSVDEEKQTGVKSPQLKSKKSAQKVGSTKPEKKGTVDPSTTHRKGCHHNGCFGGINKKGINTGLYKGEFTPEKQQRSQHARHRRHSQHGHHHPRTHSGESHQEATRTEHHEEHLMESAASHDGHPSHRSENEDRPYREHQERGPRHRDRRTRYEIRREDADRKNDHHRHHHDRAVHHQQESLREGPEDSSDGSDATARADALEERKMRADAKAFERKQLASYDADAEAKAASMAAQIEAEKDDLPMLGEGNDMNVMHLGETDEMDIEDDDQHFVMSSKKIHKELQRARQNKPEWDLEASSMKTAANLEAMKKVVQQHEHKLAEAREIGDVENHLQENHEEFDMKGRLVPDVAAFVDIPLPLTPLSEDPDSADHGDHVDDEVEEVGSSEDEDKDDNTTTT